MTTAEEEGTEIKEITNFELIKEAFDVILRNCRDLASDDPEDIATAVKHFASYQTLNPPANIDEAHERELASITLRYLRAVWHLRQAQEIYPTVVK